MKDDVPAAAVELPEWLPEPVARWAREWGDGWFNADVVIRLATDKRMKRVWARLAKRIRVPKHQTPVMMRQLAEWWEIDRFDELAKLDSDSSAAKDILLEMFFCAACTAVGGLPAKSGAWKKSTFLEACELHAGQLRAAAAWLREWTMADKSLAAAIEQAAQYCDDLFKRQFRCEIEDSLFVDRNHGNMEARGYVLKLAKLMRGLFGTFQYGTLATIASVALDQTITDKQVRNWCSALVVTPGAQG